MPRSAPQMAAGALFGSTAACRFPLPPASLCLGRRGSAADSRGYGLAEPAQSADSPGVNSRCEVAILTNRHDRASRHSITSSARSRIDGGTARPSALAVLRFTTTSTARIHRGLARTRAQQGDRVRQPPGPDFAAGISALRKVHLKRRHLADILFPRGVRILLGRTGGAT